MIMRFYINLPNIENTPSRYNISDASHSVHMDAFTDSSVLIFSRLRTWMPREHGTSIDEASEGSLLRLFF